MSTSSRVLLISNSTLHGRGYLDHVEQAIRGFLGQARRRVREGVPYIGSSAGSNVAGPTIKTTKDMPIVQPRSFEAIGLVPFQISPHYQDPDPASTHMGETQEERILQFLEENETPVVGIRESAWLVCERGAVTLKGETGARIFRRGEAPAEAEPGRNIVDLVGGPDGH